MKKQGKFLFAVLGRVRVNEAHVTMHNIPATNGVLHAIDGIL